MSYIIEGIILCWIASVFIFLAGRILFGFTVGLFASLLFIVSPASWYLSSTAVSYMSEAAMISAVLYLAILTHKYPSLKWPPVAMALTMGLGGGFRIYGTILCLPVYLIHLLDISWLRRVASVIIIIILLFTAYGWVIQKTGGWDEYYSVVNKESVKHKDALGKLLNNPVGELKKNISQIILFNHQSFGLMWFTLLIPLFFPRTLFTRLTREKLFLWAALLCPLLVFSIIYVNLTAIMLILLPIYCLVMIRGFAKVASYIVSKYGNRKNKESTKRLSELILLGCAVIVLSAVGTRYFTPESGKPSPANEFSLQRISVNDAYFSNLITTVEKYPSSETCLLLWMESKHAGYYLRDYHVIWDKYVIRKPSLAVLEIFTLKNGHRIMLIMDVIKTEKNLVCSLPLPEGCRTLIFRGDIKQLYFPFDGSLEAYPVNEDINLWAVTNIPAESGIIVNRGLGLREDEKLPPITWSIVPLAFANTD